MRNCCIYFNSYTLKSINQYWKERERQKKTKEEVEWTRKRRVNSFKNNERNRVCAKQQKRAYSWKRREALKERQIRCTGGIAYPIHC